MTTVAIPGFKQPLLGNEFYHRQEGSSSSITTVEIFPFALLGLIPHLLEQREVNGFWQEGIIPLLQVS